MKPALRGGTLFLTLLLSVPISPARAQASDPISLRQLSSSLERLSNRVRGSVVQVFSTGYGSLDEEAGGQPSRVLPSQRSTGSGVVVSADGYILTNAHVVRTARRIQVRLPASRQELSERHSIVKPEGRLLEAKLIGADRETDVAVLKVEATALPYLTLADSDTLRQGQLVMAYGNPMGLEGSVSMGIVSSIGRQIRPDDTMVYIQTDAPINPGNSGGPLIDADGRVVGINTFILSQSGGSEGIGFAIPSNIVNDVYGQLRREGHVHRGMIGAFAQTITPALARGLDLGQDWGVLIADVLPGGPADSAGLKVGDIVLALNGKVMENARQLDVNVYRHAMHQSISLDVLRGKEKLRLDVPVAEMPNDPDRFADLVSPENNLISRLNILGIGIDRRLAGMLPELRNDYGIVVAAGRALDVTSGTGLKPGDVIYSVNGAAVRSVGDLRQKLEAVQAGDEPVLQIERSGHLMYVTVDLE